MLTSESGVNFSRLSAWHWLALCAIALGTRIAAALLLPNAEQDGYSYAEMIARMSAHLAAGDFRAATLFDFWLPLYQFAAALLNIGIGDPLLAGKIVAALCGAASCILVFVLAFEWTKSVAAAWLSFVFLICSPLHILYSASSMTDVPHACFVLASLLAVTRRHWLWAAVFLSLAESIRFETWIFVALLPSLQFFYERRFSLGAIAILLLAPLLWLGVCSAATGDPLIFLADRARYVTSYLAFAPSRRGFFWPDVHRDVIYFSIGANLFLLSLTSIASVVLTLRAIRERHLPPLGPAAALFYFFGLLGFLLIAYLTKNQPVIWPRYGLIFFALALPVFAWALCGVMAKIPSRSGRIFLSVIATLACLHSTRAQLPVFHSAVASDVPHRAIGEKLRAETSRQSSEAWKCFCDDAAVRVVSGLPPSRFLRSVTTPARDAVNREAFEIYLREQRVRYVVFTAQENSLPVVLYGSDRAVPRRSPFALLQENSRAESVVALSRFSPAP
jgi:hypothetical protein